MGSLINSQLGRDILSDVLTAAAEVLRRDRRISAAMAEGVRDTAEAGAGMAKTAARVGTEVATGAAEAGADIAVAAADIAQNAAGAMARMATEAVVNMIPGSGNSSGGGSRKDKR